MVLDNQPPITITITTEIMEVPIITTITISVEEDLPITITITLPQALPPNEPTHNKTTHNHSIK